MKKFKIGDKVRVLSMCPNCHNCNGLFIGLIGKIVPDEFNFSGEDDTFTVRFEATDRYCSGFKPEVLELAEPRKTIIYDIVKFCKEKYVKI